jgi:hypothetical protein
MNFQTQIGFASVSLPATAGVFIQLPSIPCSAVGFAKTTGDLRLAGSATPGTTYLLLNTSASGQGANASPVFPTGGNSSNLFLANDVAGAQVVTFMWTLEAAKPTYPAC